MKKILFCLVLLVVSLPVLRADDAAPAASSSTQQDKKDKFLAIMDQLNLTDDQKAKVKQICANTQPGPERRRQIAAVLTPEQKMKMRQLMREQQQKAS